MPPANGDASAWPAFDRGMRRPIIIMRLDVGPSLALRPSHEGRGWTDTNEGQGQRGGAGHLGQM